MNAGTRFSKVRRLPLRSIFSTNRDGRHPMFPQPLVQGFQEAVGVGLIRPGVRKGEEVNGNPVPVKPN